MVKLVLGQAVLQYYANGKFGFQLPTDKSWQTYWSAAGFPVRFLFAKFVNDIFQTWKAVSVTNRFVFFSFLLTERQVGRLL